MYCTLTKYSRIFPTVSQLLTILSVSFQLFLYHKLDTVEQNLEEWSMARKHFWIFEDIFIEYNMNFRIRFFLPDIIPGTIRTGGGLISFLLHVSFSGIWTQDFLVIIWNFRGYEVCFEKARIFNWGPSNLLLLSTHENGFWELSPSTNVAVSTS